LPVSKANTSAAGWRESQAEHNERLARLSDAYASAYEGELQYAERAGQRIYLVRRAQRHRQDAILQRKAAERLRSVTD